MIIARGTGHSGDDLLILGLSNENVARLLKGEPIHIARVSHGDGVPEGMEILIFNGPTEDAMRKTLAATCDDNTLVIPTRLLGRDSNT